MGYIKEAQSVGQGRDSTFLVLTGYVYFGQSKSNNPAKFIATCRCSALYTPLHPG